MKSLDNKERQLIDLILGDMTPRARADYLTYRRSAGYMPVTVDQMNLCSRLYEKGWLERNFDMIEMEPVFLKHEAWNRFALDEWQEIEERIIEEKRGAISGSW